LEWNVEFGGVYKGGVYFAVGCWDVLLLDDTSAGGGGRLE